MAEVEYEWTRLEEESAAAALDVWKRSNTSEVDLFSTQPFIYRAYSSSSGVKATTELPLVEEELLEFCVDNLPC